MTGKQSTNATRASSTSGAQRTKSRLDRAFRKPTPMPRKLASSTKLVALVTYTLFAAVQRISASSTNSIRKLAKASLAGLPVRAVRQLGLSVLGVPVLAVSALPGLGRAGAVTP